MKLLIIGSGGIGGFYAAMLHHSGADVTLAARSDFATLRSNDLICYSPLGTFSFPSKNVISLGTTTHPNFDMIILTTKVLPTIDYKALISPYLSPKTTLACIQNGIDIETTYQNLFPHTPLISGVAFICVHRTSPGIIEHLDHGNLMFGTYPNGESADCIQLTNLFNTSLITAKSTSNIQKIRWKKLIWNIAFNGLSVATGGASTQEILQDPHHRKQAENLMHEVLNIAKEAGQIFKPTLIEETLKMTEKIPPYKTSMLLDFENNRPMEIEAIFGNAIQLAKRYQVATPFINKLYSTLVKIEYRP